MEQIIFHTSTRQSRVMVWLLLFLACGYVVWAIVAFNGETPVGYKLLSTLVLVPVFK